MTENGEILATLSQPREAPVGARSVRLGEELPVFCERCGYSLHGLAQLRCERCAILQFACPECGHHQPINTLRPAVQRTLGRMRAQSLALVAFLKINFFFWTLFMWGGAGTGISYDYNYRNVRGNQWVPAKFISEGAAALFLFGVAYGLIGRMLLLRWRRGLIIGPILGALVVVALIVGAHLRFYELSGRSNNSFVESPLQRAFLTYLLWSMLGVCAGAACSWGAWLSLVHLFLPKKAAAALIEWQKQMSAKEGAPDRTDVTTSVTT
jgi:hypothetical protein